MKRNLYIGLAAFAALTLSACQREAKIDTTAQKVTITLTADKAGDTRAAANEGTDKVTYTWTDEDLANLKLFVVGKDDQDKETLTAVEGVSTSLSSDNRVLSITATVEANSTLRAIVSSKLTGSDGDLNRKPRLITTQAPAVDNFDPNADILVAEDVTVSALDNEKLNFQRPVTVNKMTLKGLANGETVSKVVITSDKYLAGYYKYDTGAMYGDQKELTINYEAAAASGGEFPVYFVAMPNEGHTLNLTVETVKDSKSWRYTKTLGGTVNFTGGKFSKFGVTLSGGHEIGGDDYTGDWVITGMDGTAAYAMMAYAGGNNVPAIGIKLDTDAEEIVTTKVNSVKMHFEKVSGGDYDGFYTISDANGKYLYAASSSANQLKAGNPTTFTADYYWKVTEEEDGTYSIVAEKSSNRKIMRYNPGSMIFSCYASGQNALTIYPYSWVEEHVLQPSGEGTLASPYNVEGAIAFTEGLEAGVESDEIYIAGTICKISSTYAASGTNGNATFFISDDGKATYAQFEAYRVLYLNNQKWQKGQTDIKVGDEVVIYGKVVYYNGVVTETVQNKAYLYSLNAGAQGDTYSINIAETQHGTVTASMTSNIEAGESITITVAPESGYELETLTVDGTDVTSEVVDNMYNFDMPDHDVAVSATFKSTSTTLDFTTIAELNALVTETSASYNGKLTNAVISFVPATNTAIIKDATGSIMYYKKDHGLKQGQTFSGDISVKAIKYNGLYSEITDLGGASFEGDGATVEPETVTIATLTGQYDKYQNAYVKVVNLDVVNKDGKNINVTEGTKSYVLYDQVGSVPANAGDVVDWVVGTVTKYSTIEEIKFWKADDIKITAGSTPSGNTYTLNGTLTVGSAAPFNNYAAYSEVTQNDITWNVKGNTTMSPWRIGGKSLTDVDRDIYSTTALPMNVEKIEIEHGAASSITVNSMTVIVASDAAFSNVVSTFTPTFVASDKVTIERPTGASWDNCYYKIVYNVTVTVNSNKFVEFKGATFTGN